MNKNKSGKKLCGGSGGLCFVCYLFVGIFLFIRAERGGNVCSLFLFFFSWFCFVFKKFDFKEAGYQSV